MISWILEFFGGFFVSVVFSLLLYYYYDEDKDATFIVSFVTLSAILSLLIVFCIDQHNKLIDCQNQLAEYQEQLGTIDTEEAESDE